MASGPGTVMVKRPSMSETVPVVDAAFLTSNGRADQWVPRLLFGDGAGYGTGAIRSLSA